MNHALHPNDGIHFWWNSTVNFTALLSEYKLAINKSNNIISFYLSANASVKGVLKNIVDYCLILFFFLLYLFS